MLTKKQIVQKLSSIDIEEKIIIIHSDITGLVFKDFSVKKLWEIIFSSFGKNKIYIFPTFTFNFSKNKIWDYHKTKSETGILSEYFRTKIANKRTIHPLHSVAIYSKKKSSLMKHTSSSSFGKGSIWEQLSKSKNVCNIALGLNLDGGATFCHYAEESQKVDYREFINLPGNIYDEKNKLVNKKFKYYARKKKNKILNNWRKCEKDLKIKKIIKTYKFPKNKYQILKMNTFEVTQFLQKKIKKDSNYLIKK